MKNLNQAKQTAENFFQAHYGSIRDFELVEKTEKGFIFLGLSDSKDECEVEITITQQDKATVFTPEFIF